MYIIKCSGRRWKVREAVSLEAACNAIASARVMGSIGQRNTLRDGVDGPVTVLADVIQINSDGTDRAPYTGEY